MGVKWTNTHLIKQWNIGFSRGKAQDTYLTKLHSEKERKGQWMRRWISQKRNQRIPCM